MHKTGIRYNNLDDANNTIAELETQLVVVTMENEIQALVDAPELPVVFKALEKYGFMIPDHWNRNLTTSPYWQECWDKAREEAK